MDIVTIQNFLLFLPLSLFLSVFLQRKLTNVHNYPPGPLNLPIVGNLHKLGELQHRSFYNFSQKYGPLVHSKLGSKSIILASSSEIAKEILKTNDPKCCSRPFLTSWKKLSYGFHDVAFAPYGQEWKQIRKICVQELKSVVKETMRTHPPVPLLLQREAMEHFKINGYDIPPKAIIFINVWAIGRDPNVWEKPNKFCPERFMNSSIDYLGKDYELIPFGAGRRICPGMHMGIAVVYLALANLLYRFDWKLPNGMSIEDIDMSESPGITVHMKSALKLVAQNNFLKP